VSHRFSDDTIQQFLGTKEVVVLSTLQADGSPLSMPMWFWHDAEALTMVSVAATQKIRNVRRDPRVCVVAESGSRADARAVIVGGRVEYLDEDTPARRALVRALLDKYRPDLAQRWGGEVMPANRALFRVNPAWVRTFGF